MVWKASCQPYHDWLLSLVYEVASAGRISSKKFVISGLAHLFSDFIVFEVFDECYVLKFWGVRTTFVFRDVGELEACALSVQSKGVCFSQTWHRCIEEKHLVR